MEFSESYQQAKKCIENARIYLMQKNEEASRKFIDKAKRLCPSLEDIVTVEKEWKETFSSAQSTKKKEKKMQETKHHSKRKATKEEVELVETIIKENNYYKILKVKKNASADEIKRGFRKLALKLHPDKNPAPGAEDAFKKVAKAFQALSDPNRRTEYDRTGEDTMEQTSFPRRRRRAGPPQGTPTAYFYDPFTGTFRASPFSGFQQSPFYTTDDIFSQFFNSAQDFDDTEEDTLFRNPMFRPRSMPEKLFRMISNIWPILLFVLIAYFSTSSPTFRLYPDSTYSIEKHTAAHHVPYYVKPSFDDTKMSMSDLLTLEREVERSKLEELGEKCSRDRQRYFERHARFYYTRRDWQDLENKFSSPFCTNFSELGASMGMAF
eukprot:jgi/Galph1/5766/GphlegSOOS_G4303.1